MKLLRCLVIVFCLGVFVTPPAVYAGGGKSGSVFPRNLSVEEIARMVYEAAKSDPGNAAQIFADAISSRDSWTRGELVLVSEALLLAVPTMSPGEVVSLIVNPDVKLEDVQSAIEQLERNDGASPGHAIDALPPEVPVYPLVPTPGPVSGLR